VCAFALRRMAKFDPILSKVYRSQLRDQSYYPPQATPWAPSSTVRY
jgi:type IV secretion system protein VirB3